METDATEGRHVIGDHPAAGFPMPRPRSMTQIQLDDAEEAFDALKGQINRVRGAMEAGDGASVTQALVESRRAIDTLAYLARDIGAKAP